jgi:hypothetical protein
METEDKKPVSNTFRGKIKHVVNAPPYQIVTIELDPKLTPEITIAYIPVPGGPTLVASSTPTGPHLLAAAPSGTQGSGGGSGGSNDVTVTIPVPTGVISPIN